jgi:hypothetical protein
MADAVNVQHIKHIRHLAMMYIIFHNIPTTSLSTVTTANWRFTRIHMFETVAQDGEGGNTVLGAKFKLLYSETALHFGNRSEEDTLYMYNFCLEWPILWPPRILTFPPGTRVSRDSAVGIATGYGLDDWEVGVRVQVRVKNYYFSISSRPTLGST